MNFNVVFVHVEVEENVRKSVLHIQTAIVLPTKPIEFQRFRCPRSSIRGNISEPLAWLISETVWLGW